MIYAIFGDSPTIRIVEWLIENNAYDHSLIEIAEGTKLSPAVTRRNFEPLIKHDVVKVSRTIRRDNMYVLDTDNRCTKAIIDFDKQIAKCCEKDEPPIDENPEDVRSIEPPGF